MRAFYFTFLLLISSPIAASAFDDNYPFEPTTRGFEKFVNDWIQRNYSGFTVRFKELNCSFSEDWKGIGVINCAPEGFAEITFGTKRKVCPVIPSPHEGDLWWGNSSFMAKHADTIFERIDTTNCRPIN